MPDNNTPTVPVEEIPDEEFFSIPDNKILIDKHSLVYEYVNAKLRSGDDDGGIEYINRLYKNGKISDSEYLAKCLLAANGTAVTHAIENICDIKTLVEEEKKNPRYNIEMFLSLRFTDKVKSVKNLLPSEHATEISPGSYEIKFTDGTTLRFDFFNTYGKIRQDNATIVDFELTELDDDTFPNAIILADKLLQGGIENVSEVFLYMEDERSEDDFTIDGIEEMAVIITNNEAKTDDGKCMSTTVDITGYIDDATEITIEGC